MSIIEECGGHVITTEIKVEKKKRNSFLYRVMWSLSLIFLVPIMLFVMGVIRPIIKRYYGPKWITKWYNKTGNKWFS